MNPIEGPPHPISLILLACWDPSFYNGEVAYLSAVSEVARVQKHGHHRPEMHRVPSSGRSGAVDRHYHVDLGYMEHCGQVNRTQGLFVSRSHKRRNSRSLKNPHTVCRTGLVLPVQLRPFGFYRWASSETDRQTDRNVRCPWPGA